MIKRIGLAGVALVVVLALGGLGAQAASAAACYKISEFRVKVKGGAYRNASCTEVAGVLEGEYSLVNLLFKTTGNLWCADQTTFQNQDGYYEDSQCTIKLPNIKRENESIFTEVEVLPDISVTLCQPNCGRSYPLHLNYLSNTVKTELQSVAGSVLKGEGLHVLYLIGELTSLGTFRALFLKVTKGASEKCFNQGEEENGEVLTEGSFHVVYTSLAGSSQGLQLGILYLVTELNEAHSNIIKCPRSGIDVEVRGSVIGTLNLGGGTEMAQFTGLKGLLNGTKGKQSFRAYWNDFGTALLAKLESDVGAGFLESNQIVEGEPESTSLEGKMFVITNR
jgi:hypothetical protein